MSVPRGRRAAARASVSAGAFAAAVVAALAAAACASGHSARAPMAVGGAQRPSPHEDLDLRDLGPIPYGPAGWVSPALRPTRPFNEVLPSWNIDLPPGTGVAIELSVGDRRGWSPWLHIGDWGRVPASRRVVRCARGRVEIDIFRSDSLFDRARIRLRAFAPRGSPHPRDIPPPRLRRLHLCFSDTTQGLQARPPSRGPRRPPLRVPAIRQGTAPAAIASRVCSPASVAMALGALGRRVALTDACAAIFDPVHDLYGVWNRAVQYAWTQGVPGYLTRIAAWDRVLELTEIGHPIVASIAFQEGALRNAPFRSSKGHLIVILGLRPDGDPAAGPGEAVLRAYHREDLDRCWIARGGYCYVFGG